MAEPFTIQWVPAVGDAIEFSQAAGFRVRELSGDWGASWQPVNESSPTGDESVASGATFSPGVISIPVIILPDSAADFWDNFRAYAASMRPYVTRFTPNNGYLFYTQTDDIGVSTTHRRAVRPLPLRREQTYEDRAGGGYAILRTVFEFQALSEYWEVEPPDANPTVIKAQADATWIVATTTVTTTGDAHTFPTWEFDGPTAGTITSITVTNSTLGAALGTLQFNGLALVAGQRLTVMTAPGELSAVVTTVSTGAVVMDAYPLRTQTSNWWALEAGANDLVIAKAATSQSRVAIRFRSRSHLI